MLHTRLGDTDRGVWRAEGSLGPDYQLSGGDETMSEVAQEGIERNRRNMGPCRTLRGGGGGGGGAAVGTSEVQGLAFLCWPNILFLTFP